MEGVQDDRDGEGSVVREELQEVSRRAEGRRRSGGVQAQV